MTIMKENYVGNVLNTAPLAILLGDINSVKQNWMAGDVVSFRDNNPVATAQKIRAVSGPPPSLLPWNMFSNLVI